LSIDSPGGLLSGCFDTARELRAMAAAAGKPLYAYVDGTACSAAYALACAAEKIWLPDTAVVGSIGVYEMLVDTTKADEQFGYRFEVITSGARKADGNPHQAISASTLAARQVAVDEFASLFFDLVSELRGLGADQLRALEAGSLIGKSAVSTGLADAVLSLDPLLALIASGNASDGTTQGESQGETAMTKEELKSALTKMAEGDDEDAKTAKRCLAAMDDGDGDGDEKKEHKEPDGDESKSEEEKKDDKADADGDNDGDEKKDDKKEEASASAGEVDVLALARDVHQMKVEAQVKAQSEEREQLLSSRPDFDPKIVATLRKLPIAQVKEAVKTWPRAAATRGQVSAARAALEVKATRGEGQQGGAGDRLPPDEARALSVRMGLERDKAPIRHEGNHLVLGVMTREDAKAYSASQKANVR
jgi:ClpP class serine protease